MSQLPLRRLGDSDLEVSVLGLGCNNFGRRVDLEGTRAVVDAALDEGVNFLDTADMYGDGRSEELLGEVLAGRRDRLVLATKFGWTAGGTRETVLEACDASLRRLRTDVIDLYWYHRPDGKTPIAETLGALDELVRAGKVRFIGCSNFDAGQLEEADAAARENGLARFVAIQNQYSLLRREIEDEVVPAALRLGLGVIPYFPLASGLLTGKYRRGQEPPEGTRLAGRTIEDSDLEAVEAIEAYAGERGASLLDVAIGGLAAMPGVTSVIAGATKPEQVRANAAAVRWSPTEAELQALPA
jgi:aryl-alcohol dehydrogenase-like predicted oxidoreductase